MTFPLPYPHIKDHEAQANFEAVAGAIQPRQPTAFSYLANAFSHTSTGNFQAVTLDTNLFDTGSLWDSSNGRFVIRKTGLYLVCGQVMFAGNATGVRIMAIYQSGTIRGEGAAVLGSVSNIAPSHSMHMKLTAGDTIALYGFQSSGGNLAYATGAAPYAAWLSIGWVSTF